MEEIHGYLQNLSHYFEAIPANRRHLVPFREVMDVAQASMKPVNEYHPVEMPDQQPCFPPQRGCGWWLALEDSQVIPILRFP